MDRKKQRQIFLQLHTYKQNAFITVKEASHGNLNNVKLPGLNSQLILTGKCHIEDNVWLLNVIPGKVTPDYLLILPVI